MLTNKTILVAGGSGLVGRPLIEELLKGNNTVHTIARFRDPAIQRDLEYRGVKTFKADLARKDLNKVEGLRREYDIVFHEIAIIMEAEDDRPYAWETNAYSVARLIEFCSETPKFVIASTGGVYFPSDESRSETDAMACVGTYGATKIAMEALATYLCQKQTSTLSLLRYHWPYSATRGMIPGLVQAIAKGDTIPINRQNRSIVHPQWIDDTVRLTLAAADKASTPAYLVNIAGEESIEREELVHRIAKMMGREPVINDTPDFPKVSHIADLTKMHSDLGHSQVSLDEGIRRVIAAMK